MIVASLSIITLMLASVEKNIPLLTKAGKNSLAIYLLHRPFTLLFSEKFSASEFQISAAIIATFLMTLIFGSDKFSSLLKKFLNNIVESLTTIKGVAFRVSFLALIIFVMFLPMMIQFSAPKPADKIFRVMTAETVAKFDNSFKILFCGDLILFEDQVKRGFNGKNLMFFCPGNFANIYREYNGDASAMVEVYIDKNTKKIIGGSIIPLWTESKLDGNYRALPINEIFTNKKLRSEISTRDFERVEEVLRHVTKIMLGDEINFNQQKYFFDEGGFMRKKVSQIDISDEMRGDFYKSLIAAENVCFIGDSLTEGTKNGGVPYFEPLETLIRGKIFNISQGGATTKILLERLDEIIQTGADLFVVAVGTNDVRYRDENICSMTPEEYIFNLKKLRDAVKNKNPAAKFIFIAPWTSTDGDFISRLSFDEKIKLNDEYSAALKDFCAANGEIFINANPYIDAHLKIYPHKNYLIDFIHPNADEGVKLYSEAVLLPK